MNGSTAAGASLASITAVPVASGVVAPISVLICSEKLSRLAPLLHR